MYNLKHFYRLTKKDIRRASDVLARSYAGITLYKKATESVKEKHHVLATFFEVAVRYGIKYGYPYAFSQKLEGIAIWLPYKKADMSMWGMIRSGALMCFMKLARNGRELLSSIKVMSQLDNDRRENMAGKRYLDLFCLAVDPDHQRKGIASKLVRAMFEKADSSGYAIYVSSDIDSVDFYRKHGFQTIKEVSVNINGYDLLNFEMARYSGK